VYRSFTTTVNINVCVRACMCVCELNTFKLFHSTRRTAGTTTYPKVSGLSTCSENCKWYSSLPLGAVVSLLCEPV